MSSANDFTLPKRRKCFEKNSYSSDVKTWTTAQCHRLLRPISSRIEILKRDSIRYAYTRSPPVPSQSMTKGIIPTHVIIGEIQDADVDRDPDWRPGRKRLRRTYSGRRKVKHKNSIYDFPAPLEVSQEPLVPGEILIPTPILNRKKDVDDLEECIRPYLTAIAEKPKASGQVRGLCPIKDRGTHFQLSEHMRQIKATTDPIRYSLYDGIYNALDMLLRATKPAPSGQSTPRSKTLLSLCLRAIPFYIKEEVAWMSSRIKESGIDTSIGVPDVSAETYSNLESFGSSIGWKHLRTVVRAHGIAIVSDAIAGGFISSKFASVLIMLCVHTSFYDEGESLLDSFLISFHYPYPESAQSRLYDNPEMLPLLTLSNFVKHTGRVGYYHRTLATLFSAGSLPVAWLATKDFTFVWNSIFLSLSSNPPDHNASTFMSTMLPVLYSAIGVQTIQDDMLSVLDATFTSVVTTLSAMVNRGWKITQILRSVIIDCGFFNSILEGKQAKVIATANLLVSLNDFMVPTEDREFFEQLINVLGRNRCHASTTVECVDDVVSAFICSVARCCGRGSSNGFGHLKIMLEQLGNSDISPLGGEEVLSRIIVSSAFAFAQQNPKLEHLGYAEKMKTKYRGLCGPKELSSGGYFHTDFRWEEGISEWVTTTPATLKRGRDIRLSLSSESDDETSTQPTQPNFKRHKPATSDQLAKELQGAYLNCSQVSDLAPPTPYTDSKSTLLLARETRVKKSSYREPYVRIPSNRPRKPAHKAHRAGQGFYLSREDCNFLEGSDDELNSAVLGPPENRLALSEVSHCLNSRCRKVTAIVGKRTLAKCSTALASSEDELGV